VIELMQFQTTSTEGETPMKNRWTIPVTAAVLALAGGAAQLDAAVINETAAHDRQLTSVGSGGANVGLDTLIRVGNDPGGSERMFSVLRWTLSSVPGSELATGDGVITLNLNAANPEGGAFNGQTIEAYAILPSNAGWNEATPGDYASWDYRNTPDSVTPGTPWVGGSGLGGFTPGLGYAATPFDTFTWTGQNVITLDVPQSLINDWITNPSGNAGIVLRQATATATNGFIRLHSRQEETAALGPTLSFVSAVPEPASLCLVVTGAMLMLKRRRGA
jgi:hypothetical protein